MTLDLGRVLSQAFSITWRHKWLWLLGVFGGGSVGFRGNFPSGSGSTGGTSSAQVQQFLTQWAWLIILAVVVLLVVILVTFILSCIAIPAATWAALALDAGEPATLGSAWRQGARRFWVYVRLALVRLGIALVLAVVAGALFLVGLLVYSSAGRGSLLVLIPVGILLFLAIIVVAIVLAFLFAWSERMPVVLGLGAVDALRISARVARRAWVDTLVFAIVMGLVAGIVGVGVLLVAAVFAIPGVAVALVGLGSSSSALIGIGIVLALFLGGAILIIGGGFVGALVQVAYALACRDLCMALGMAINPEVPQPGVASPELTPLPPALA